MKKIEWLEDYLAGRKANTTIEIDLTGLAWAGFWIGLGLVLAAQVITTHEAIFK